jgi:drug/metabolite transporter (DMT)-like permease
LTGAYLKLAAMIILVSAGQVFMKLGALRVQYAAGRPVFRSFFNPFLIAGGASVVFAPLLYFSALREIPLSAAYGFTGLTYLIVFLCSWLLLKERITGFHAAGIILIAAGFGLWNL